MRKWIALLLFICCPYWAMAYENTPLLNFFSRVYEVLKNPGKLGGIVIIIFFGILIDLLLKKWIARKDAIPAKRRLRRLRWYPLLRFITWSTATLLIIYTLLKGFAAEELWPPLTALALGVGLAFKDGLVDLLSGLWLIFESPYQIGDRINVDGHYGEVTRIGIRSTQLTTLDDNLVTIPNSAILGAPVANATASETDCMAVVRIWLPLNADLQQMRTIAHEAAITSRYFNFYKGVTILFQDHLGEPAGTILQIKAYVSDARFEKAFEGDVTETVKGALVKAGVY